MAEAAWLPTVARVCARRRETHDTWTLSIDAGCLRQKADENHDFGYEMMKRFMTLLVQRLHAAQLQMLDVYGSSA